VGAGMETRRTMLSRGFRFLVVAVVTLGFFTLFGGCTIQPNWQELYTDKLGQEIVEMDDTYLGQEFTDPVESGSLTRAAWARLVGGEIILLGLPPHGFEPQEVVDRTIILRAEAWRDACSTALDRTGIEGWRMPHAHRGNSVRIYVGDGDDTYCQFFFLPEGWELRTVFSQGIVKPRTIAALGQ